jgi:hypothetical protein
MLCTDNWCICDQVFLRLLAGAVRLVAQHGEIPTHSEQNALFIVDEYDARLYAMHGM